MPAKSYTTEELRRRYVYLEKRGRRCDEIERRCSQSAVVEVTTYTVHPTTKERTSPEPTTRKLCSRHRTKYEAGGIYEVVKVTDVP